MVIQFSDSSLTCLQYLYIQNMDWIYHVLTNIDKNAYFKSEHTQELNFIQRRYGLVF